MQVDTTLIERLDLLSFALGMGLFLSQVTRSRHSHADRGRAGLPILRRDVTLDSGYNSSELRHSRIHQSTMYEPAPSPDRSHWNVNKTTLQESKDGRPPGGPEDWLKMMWPLACEAWAMKGEPVDESRLLRHIVRVQRGRG